MLSNMFGKHKFAIAATYSVFLVEFLIFALLPSLLGMAVDAMLLGKGKIFSIYIAISMSGMLLGWFRRRLDTRVFIGIWAKYTADAVNNLICKGVDPTRIISRSGFVTTYIHFIEYWLPMFVSAVINICIACTMISIASPKAGGIVIGLTSITLFSCFRFAHKIQVAEIKAQEIREDLHAAIINTNQPKVYRCYRNTFSNQVINSDLMAASWGVMDTMLVIAVAVVVASVVGEGHSLGIITATLTYTNRIFEKIDCIGNFFCNLKQIEIANDLLQKEE